MEEYAVQQGEAYLEDGVLFALRKTGDVAKDRFTRKQEPDKPPQDDSVYESLSGTGKKGQMVVASILFLCKCSKIFVIKEAVA